MKPHSNTTASTSSSGASSNPPNPQPHGLRSQLGHLLPRHAVFQVRLHIDQLSNVPLIKGEFGVRYKFKNVQSGSGLVAKMKAHRTTSGQGKGKEPEREAQEADDGEGEGEGASFHSTQDTTEDDRSAESPRSPRERASDVSYPPSAPTPAISGGVVGANAHLSAVPLQTESRGVTPWAVLQNYNVRWAHTVNAAVQMDVHRETGDLLPSELKLTIMQRVIPGDPDSPQQPRLGVVYLNLAEYADAGPVTRRYLLRQSKTNATLKLTIELEHVGGEKHYKPPPLRKGEILASVSGILSNNGLFNTRFARELDLYVGADRPETESVFPYADGAGHVQPDALATSFGLRTTEHLIEALFNPVPSEGAEPTPFTYYAPPQPERSESPQPYDVLGTIVPGDAVETRSSQGRRSVGRRSVDSSVSSASYVASTSEHSSAHDPGMAADPSSITANRHWWQKMRSRPSTPASRHGFRATATPTPVPPLPVPVRNG